MPPEPSLQGTKFCYHKVKAEAYTTFVCPILEYASAVWDPATTNNMQILEAVQRRAEKSVTKGKHQPTNWGDHQLGVADFAGEESQDKSDNVLSTGVWTSHASPP